MNVLGLYRFLGNVRFALMLIFLTTLFVVAGTFIESFFDSHAFAARFTYSNPLFLLILGGFFINILFSALQRWPFKYKHIPFLMTHLGLLMILLGTFVKNIWGIQGNMVIHEGGGKQEILLPSTQAILLESFDKKKQLLPIQHSESGDFTINITQYHPQGSRQRLSI